MNNTTVSIIVPVYNVEQYLKRCLDSIIHQSYYDIEVIVVDDGSTDNSLSITRQYTDQRIKVIEKTNGGLSSARNEGIRHASGDYITFIDSDDWIDNSMLEKMVFQASQYNADIVCVDELSTDGDIGIKKNQASIKVFYGQDCLSQLLSLKVKTYSWGKLYKMETIKHLGCFFPEGYNYEDVATSYKLFNCCTTLVTIKERLYFYFQRANSIVKTKRIEEVESIVKHIETMNTFKIDNPFWGYYRLSVLYGAYVYLLKLNNIDKTSERYNKILKSIIKLKQTIKLEKPLLSYMCQKSFYKVFLSKLNMEKLSLLK